MTADLIERLRARAARLDFFYRASNATSKTDPDAALMHRAAAELARLTTALATARRDGLEEAAETAEVSADTYEVMSAKNNGHGLPWAAKAFVARDIAAAIRKLED